MVSVRSQQRGRHRSAETHPAVCGLDEPVRVEVPRFSPVRGIGAGGTNGWDGSTPGSQGQVHLADVPAPERIGEPAWGMAVVDIPGSKSITARALFLAAAADGVTTLVRPLR